MDINLELWAKAFLPWSCCLPAVTVTEEHSNRIESSGPHCVEQHNEDNDSAYPIGVP